jgi:uncharacterized protein (DUF1501 family)
MQTAHSLNPALSGEIPHIGAVVAYESGAKGLLPPFLSFNQTALQGATFLGGPYSPMMPPATRTGVATLSHNFFGSASQQRFEDRFRLLQDLDEPLRQNPLNEVVAAYGGYYARAKSMMYNDAVDATFKFSVDDENRYGANSTGRAAGGAERGPRQAGRFALNVTQGGWDTHASQFDRGLQQNNYNLAQSGPRRGIAGGRPARLGRLDSTLIVMMGEFGRTPRD